MKQKMYTLFLSITISSTVALAQPVIGLQKTIGGSSADDFTSMFLTKDSGLIIGGSSLSDKSGNKLENSKGSYDYWILLLNRQGGIRGQKTIGGNSSDYLKAVEQTADGGYILGGSSSSGISGDKTENSRGRDDYWIVKLDGKGKIQWDKTIGGSDNDDLQTIKATSDGGYIAGGYSNSNKSGEKTQNTRGNNQQRDYWVVKLNGNGNIQWDKTIGGNGSDELHDIIQTNDGGYLLGGTSGSSISGEKTDSSRGGGSDYWIVKLDNAGNIEWDKTFGGDKSDGLWALVQTNDGGYLLGGNSSSGKSGEKMQSNRGAGADYWIIKTNNLGQIEWSNTYGGKMDDFLWSVELTSDGGYMLGGYSVSDISGQKTENGRGEFDSWIIKVSGNGAIQWDKTIGGEQSEIRPKTKEIARNRYVVASPSPSGIAGDKMDESHGVNDYWLVELRYSNPDSISVTTLPNSLQVNTDKSTTGFSVYPNPATDVLHVQATGKNNYILTSQSGKTILTKTITNNGDMDVSRLQPGVYFLSNQTKTARQKIIISR